MKGRERKRKRKRNTRMMMMTMMTTIRITHPRTNDDSLVDAEFRLTKRELKEADKDSNL